MKMEEGGLMITGSLLCVKGVTELDSEEWQKRGRERSTGARRCHSDISVLLYLALFSLLFTSLPTMPQLLFSKKRKRNNVR